MFSRLKVFNSDKSNVSLQQKCAEITFTVPLERGDTDHELWKKSVQEVIKGAIIKLFINYSLIEQLCLQTILKGKV